MKNHRYELLVIAFLGMVLIQGLVPNTAFGNSPIVLDNCDSKDGWWGSAALNTDDIDHQEGAACLSSTGADLITFAKSFSPLETGITENQGFLKFWLFISDVSKYDNIGQIEITSSGQFDVDEYSWDLNGLFLKDGWNYLSLNIYSAGKNGSPDLNAINFFRLYMFANGDVTVKIDHIIFSDFENLPISGAVLDPCDELTGWQGDDGLSLSPENKIEGPASLVSSGTGSVRFQKVFDPIDANVSAEKGYLSFWLYVSQQGAFAATGEVEISSSGQSDEDEYNWPIACLDLENGWNYVNLKITDATVIGNPDLSLITFFRFYNTMSDNVLLRLDDIHFSENSPPMPHIVNANSLENKALFGYQGWFAAPGDSSEHDRWVHWFNNNSPNEENATFDNWPDLSEYEEGELFPTDLRYSNGEVAKLFSAYRYKTVDRHVKWMYENQLDGMFLQRFISNTRYYQGLDFVDKVTRNVKSSCEKYGRVFAIEFCIQQNEDYWVDQIKSDWMHLVDDLNVTLSPSYLKHKGYPLIGIYGIGFQMYSYATPEEAQELINWFHHDAPEKYRATVMTGVPSTWRTDDNYIDFYSTVDVIKPWSVGNYNDIWSVDDFLNRVIRPDKAFCDSLGIDYIPVIWPGFSWYNLMRDGDFLKNNFPRNGGEFYWRQSYNVNRANVNMIFIAMYDEVDEGTAMFKIEPKTENTPDQGYWVALDADGYDVPSDWYLRLASETGRLLRDEIISDPRLPRIPSMTNIDSIHIVRSVVPQIYHARELHACQGDTIPVIPTVLNAETYVWSTGGTGGTILLHGDETKEIWLQASNQCGTSSDTFKLHIHPNPLLDLGTADSVLTDETVMLSPGGEFVKYTWNNIPGDSLFVASKNNLNPGSNLIALSVTDQYNCTSTDTIDLFYVDENTTHYWDQGARKLVIYPNPVQDRLTIQSTDSETHVVEIISAKGVAIYQINFHGSWHSLDLSAFKSGIYFVTVRSKESVTTEKFVKL